MADFSEQQVFEALGLGGKEQETAAPAPETDPTANQETDPTANQETDPAPETDRENGPEAEPESGEPGQEGEDGGAPEGGSAGGKPPLTEEQRRENAAQRRRAETQAAIDRAVEEAVQAERDRARAEMDAFFASAALKNTITGKPITTMEEFSEWKQAFDANQLQKDLKAGRLTPEALQRALEQTPSMQQVRHLPQPQDAHQHHQAQAAAHARPEQQIAEPPNLDPSITDVTTLLNKPKTQDFYPTGE